MSTFKTYKVQCLDCDYADEILYPYQKQAIREMARHHARHFNHKIKETEIIEKYYG
jgi:hypothetical protein